VRVLALGVALAIILAMPWIAQGSLAIHPGGIFKGVPVTLALGLAIASVPTLWYAYEKGRITPLRTLLLAVTLAFIFAVPAILRVLDDVAR
jgi:hypothetical protein